MKEILKGIFDSLGMNEETGLASIESRENLSAYQKLIFDQVREKMGIDAVYFLRDTEGNPRIPMVYFSVVDEYNPDQIAELHKLAWNCGNAPLLFVITPDEIKVFNNYRSPKVINDKLSSEDAILDTISLITGMESQRDKLKKYHRSLLESGDFWKKSGERFNTREKVDSSLLSNLKILRRTLIEQIVERDNKSQDAVVKAVHSLLNRSIFVKYLEERKDSFGNTVFPDDYFSQFGQNCQCYVDLLESKESTYDFFDKLFLKLNGDMLKVTENEQAIIQQEDLQLLKGFLIGDYELESGQYSLFPLYNFNVIPIQLISSIYELFFHLETKDDEKGTYYTPLHLVDLLMEEVCPWEGNYSCEKYLDPSCGSGIFLVEAYRRQVFRWINKKNEVNSRILGEILKSCIFGVDINEEAIHVAAFSLSLAMCDFLEPKSIWEELSFPRLIGTNLIVSDFFSPDMLFNDDRFEVIIGNPPWQSSITGYTHEYLASKDFVIGDKQIAQAFSWKCAELCASNGIVCLLMPSKPLLFNRSRLNCKYRRDFFEKNTVLALINLSLYRKILFEHATGPATALIFEPLNEEYIGPIAYCTPKPYYTFEDYHHFSIDPSDICKIPRDFIYNDMVWKVAMWGTPRDLQLIDKIRNTFITLSDFMRNNDMVSAEGFKRGNKSKICDDFLGLPFIEAKTIRPFFTPWQMLKTIDFVTYECTVDQKRVVFEAPHLVIKQSHRDGMFVSNVLNYDAAFNHSLLGIHGDANLLMYLSILISSRVFSYYHILTNRKWMVERDELEAGDIWDTPIPVPNEQDINKAKALFVKCARQEKCASEIEEFARDMYHLFDYERHQIDDVIDYVFDYYAKKGKSTALKVPDDKVYNTYFKAISEILANTFGKTASTKGVCFVGNSPLTVQILQFTEEDSGSMEIIHDDNVLYEQLKMLDSFMGDQKQNVFIRRNIRIYQKDKVFIIKPAQRKYWTYSSACRDADEIFADISTKWR